MWACGGISDATMRNELMTMVISFGVVLYLLGVDAACAQLVKLRTVRNWLFINVLMLAIAASGPVSLGTVGTIWCVQAHQQSAAMEAEMNRMYEQRKAELTAGKNAARTSVDQADKAAVEMQRLLASTMTRMGDRKKAAVGSADGRD